MSIRYGERARMLGAGMHARVGQWFQRSLIKSIQRGTIAITGATSITATVDTSPGADITTAGYELIEYWPGVIRSVQRGTILFSAPTATITAVNTAKSEVDYLGSTDNAGLSLSTICRMFLTNSTTVTMSMGVTNAETGGYQVVEWC